MAERKKDFERGNRISDRREKMGLSQAEVASRIGIGRQALSAIENGGSFAVEILAGLASVLDTTCEYILHGEAEESKDALLAEANRELLDMDDFQIRQAIAILRAMKSVSPTM